MVNLGHFTMFFLHPQTDKHSLFSGRGSDVKEGTEVVKKQLRALVPKVPACFQGDKLDLGGHLTGQRPSLCYLHAKGIAFTPQEHHGPMPPPHSRYREFISSSCRVSKKQSNIPNCPLMMFVWVPRALMAW